MVICGTPGGRPLQSCVYIKFVQALRICSIVGVDSKIQIITNHEQNFLKFCRAMKICSHITQALLVLGDPFKFAQTLRKQCIVGAIHESPVAIIVGEAISLPFNFAQILREDNRPYDRALVLNLCKPCGTPGRSSPTTQLLTCIKKTPKDEEA